MLHQDHQAQNFGKCQRRKNHSHSHFGIRLEPYELPVGSVATSVRIRFYSFCTRMLRYNNLKAQVIRKAAAIRCQDTSLKMLKHFQLRCFARKDIAEQTEGVIKGLARAHTCACNQGRFRHVEVCNVPH